jgi:hypothetical protein
MTGRWPFWLWGIYGVLIAACGAMIAIGVRTGATEQVSVGFLGLVIAVAAMPIAVYARRASHGGVEHADNAELKEMLREMRKASEESALSDDARRVLHRKRERELLRRAIQEDISAKDYDAAMVLVKELAERFGYRADAEEFRKRIEAARFESIEAGVAQAIAGLDRLITQRKWNEARAEAQRITRLYPESLRVDGLRLRVDHALGRYKEDLERRFLQAAEQERVEDAFALLRELDGYLTESEAEPFREVARGVIGKARENLGVRFKLAVQDKRWAEAAAAGERIIAQFPNSRMAEEVRGLIDQVRERAATASRA